MRKIMTAATPTAVPKDKQWSAIQFLTLENILGSEIHTRTYVVVDLVVNRPLMAQLSLYTRLKPTCNKKIGIMGLVYILN